MGESHLLVDSVHVVLRFDGDTRTPHYLLVLVRSLRALEVGRAIEPVARVDHDARLVGTKLCLNAREDAPQRDNDRIGRRIVNQEVPVIAFARPAATAIAGEAGEQPRMAQKHIRCARKIIDAFGLRRFNLACGQGPVVRHQISLRVWHIQRMVPDLNGFGVFVRIEVEVRMLRKHESCEALPVSNLGSYLSDRNASSDERDLTLGDTASILMFHLFPATLYVTLANTRPGIPWDELASSRTVNVIESFVAAVTFHVL